MTKIDVFSGFLGAGKTTLIKKLIAEAYQGERLVLIENEFGEIGIDGGFMQEAGIQVTEMNSGCICCSLVGDFTEALGKVLEQYHPDRILIEPSGVGKLSDVIRAVEQIGGEDVVLNSYTAIADATKCKMYMKNFGEFYNDQITHAGCIVLSRTDGMSEDKLAACVALLREKNPHAPLITTPWPQLSGKQILEAMERQNTLQEELEHLAAESCPVCGHAHEHEHEHHHHHEHGEECHCHDHEHEHHHHEHDHEHEHHHHEHDHDHEHHHHDHHHEHGEECHCHEHHHHHHHADEVFDSWGTETATAYTPEEIRVALGRLADEHTYGVVLRAKGIVAGEDGEWIHFDYVPDSPDVRRGAAAVSGRLCVIGSQLQKAALAALFRLPRGEE
ncbi:MAG: GTP-binding protein [Clostridia bacterium]|nr:GTP-binding protein [Clostridia bacterium]